MYYYIKTLSKTIAITLKVLNSFTPRLEKVQFEKK
jgi:hypothetical protein